MSTSSTATRWLTLALFAGLAGLTLWVGLGGRRAEPHDRLLLAPMFNLLEPCVQPPRAAVKGGTASVEDWCGRGSASLAPVVEATVSALGPALPANPRLEVGYTLQIPLLRMLRREGSDWAVDRPALQKLVRTLQENDRPAVVYLFSTHFSALAPIEHELAKDPANLLASPKGPLPIDTYYDDEVFPWSFVRTDNGITRRRLQVIDAFLDEVCRMEVKHQRKIRGITMLGELHHMFPKFQSGMGFDSPYVITDYSVESRQEFRRFLQLRFRTIRNFNTKMGTHYPSFGAIEPPGKDVRTEPLKHFTEHIDAYAHGSFPVAGWVRFKQDGPKRMNWVRIYRNGEYLGRTPVRGGRQDVLSAHPDFDPDLGWQYDLDFRQLPFGMHTIDIMLEPPTGPLLHLGTRRIAVMGREQRPPPELPSVPLPPHEQAQGKAQWYVDGPPDQTAFFYNPLVPLWHEFRGDQVVRYLQFMDNHIRQSCLKDTALYTHQILPFVNPGWDRNRFAVERSLSPFGPTQTGISLYGEATYGNTFPEWYETSRLSSYGITEFHPLKKMTPDEVDAVFERHRLRGAAFLSFFLEPRGLAPGRGVGLNQFSFNPEVPNFFSDTLYRSTQETINRAPAAGAAPAPTSASSPASAPAP